MQNCKDTCKNGHCLCLITSTKNFYVFFDKLEKTISTNKLNCNTNFNALSIPLNWTCLSEYYNTSDGCDCGCGAYDPDCDSDSYIFNCYNGKNATCDKDGICHYQYAVPDNWECEPDSYNSSDACDCNCGIYDPDCNNASLDIFNCPSGEICLPNGNCSNNVVPSAWVCKREYYNAKDGCDCNCGAPDPDCEDSNSVLLNCPCSGMYCNYYGFCSGPCSGYYPINGWGIAFGVLLSVVVFAVILLVYKVRYYKKDIATNYTALNKF